MAKTLLEKIRQERRRKAARAQRAAERERAMQDQLAMAIDKAQDDRLAQEIGPILLGHGHGKVEQPATFLAEQERVKALIESDLSYRARESVRLAAEIKLSEDPGHTASLLDAVVEPTPEWLRQGESMPFTPKQPDGTVRVVTTRRRVVTGQCLRAFRAGRMTDEQYRACAWYQAIYERSGLEGAVRSADMAREVRGQAVSGYTFTDAQLDAQRAYRAARASMPPRWVKFFELVVLNDTAVDRARRIAPSGRHAWVTLRTCAEAVSNELKNIDPDWKGD